MPTIEPEVGNLLHLAVVTQTQELWHTIRYESGNWRAFGNVESEAGEIGYAYDVDLQSMGGSVHACVSNGKGEMYHTYRRPDGTWLPFEDVKAKAGDVAKFLRVSLCATGGFRDGQLHFFGTTNEHPIHPLYYANLKADGVTWESFVKVNDPARAGDIGPITCVASAGDVSPAAHDLHLCAINEESGKLFHAIRRGDGTWTAFEDVGMAGAGSLTVALNVDCEMVGRNLHIFVTTLDEKIMYTVRTPAGTYSPFQDIGGDTGYPDTMREIAIGGTNGQLQVASITINSKLWHTVRDPGTGRFSMFGDVEAQTGDIGKPITVGAHGLYIAP